jgi:hypothetical protein
MTIAYTHTDTESDHENVHPTVIKPQLAKISPLMSFITLRDYLVDMGSTTSDLVTERNTNAGKRGYLFVSVLSTIVHPEP